jgi:NAD(P)-dependent dehydrogenase (short-subunit alcohol dehydrogenase family)
MKEKRKTILITGGTQGIGKALAMHLLNKGNRVIVVGSSQTKGDNFIREFNNSNLIFIQSNLSLVKENERLINEFKEKYSSLDILVLCAQSQAVTNEYKQTAEGFEFVFGLYYLSRYVLSYGLKDLLSKSENPAILNVCGTGTSNGKIKWDDLQLTNNYGSLNAIMQGNRLHDLAGVAFNQNNNTNVKYILYNPGIVRTKGAKEAFSNPILRTIVKIIGQPVNKAIKPIIELLNKLPKQSLSVYKQRKLVNLTGKTFDKQNAQRLHELTEKLINRDLWGQPPFFSKI